MRRADSEGAAGARGRRRGERVLRGVVRRGAAAGGDALQAGGAQVHGALAARTQEGRALRTEDLPHVERVYRSQGRLITG